MPELRWILLVLGVLFLAGLAWWELRRPRQAGRGELGGPSEREADAAPPAEAHAPREPAFTLPEMRARDPLPEIPAIEVPDDLSIALRVDAAGDEDIDLLACERGEQIVPPASEPQAPPDPLLDRQDAPPDPPREPIVEWPDESIRRIVALRLVCAGERFPGHAVRQALTAEGFVLGKLAIFHRPGPDGRAVVSAANISKPGTFDRVSLEAQRFSGLSLFAVLPGPLPADRAFDELLACARNLSARLQGELQDERGATLTPLRAAEMREALEVHAEHQS